VQREEIRAGMARASIDLIGLWAGYVTLGGTKGADTIGRYLLGELVLDASDHQLLVTVIEDRLAGSPRSRSAATPKDRDSRAHDEEGDHEQRG
jgi:hypothetical protein